MYATPKANYSTSASLRCIGAGRSCVSYVLREVGVKTKLVLNTQALFSIDPHRWCASTALN